MVSQVVVLAIAGGSFAVGLALFLYVSHARRFRYVYTGHLVAWLLMSLSPVLVLFSFFPGSSVNAKIQGGTVSGAIGAFLILLFWLGREGRLVQTKIAKPSGPMLG